MSIQTETMDTCLFPKEFGNEKITRLLIRAGNKQKSEKQSIFLLNKNYVYLASESPRGVNFHFHDSNLFRLANTQK